MQRVPVWKVGAMVATTGAVTVAGWFIGRKYKHPWIGAAVGAFLVAPMVNTPMAMSLTNDLMGSAGTDTSATPGQVQSMGVRAGDRAYEGPL